MWLDGFRRQWNRASKAIKRNPKTSIAVVVVSSIAGLSYYAYSKLRPYVKDLKEAMKLIQEMEKQEANEVTAWDRGFQTAMQISRTTLNGCTSDLHKRLNEIFDIASIRKSMRRGQARDSSELSKWEEFKISTFARTFSAIYVVCIINVFVNIQVCIVQRYNADNSEERPSVNVFKAFLETSHFFMTEGCKKLAEKVKHHLESCEDMKVPLGELFSMSHLLDCVLEFRASMEDVIQSDVHQDTPNSISETYEEYVSSFIFPSDVASPPDSLSPSDELVFKEMVAEASSLLRTQDFRNVLCASFDAGFSRYTDLMSKSAFDTEESVPLVKLLSPSAKAFDSLLPEALSPALLPLLSGSPAALSDPLLNLVHSLKAVRDFCSLIYYPLDYSKPKQIFLDQPNSFSS